MRLHLFFEYVLEPQSPCSFQCLFQTLSRVYRQNSRLKRNQLTLTSNFWAVHNQLEVADHYALLEKSYFQHDRSTNNCKSQPRENLRFKFYLVNFCVYFISSLFLLGSVQCGFYRSDFRGLSFLIRVRCVISSSRPATPESIFRSDSL